MYTRDNVFMAMAKKRYTTCRKQSARVSKFNNQLCRYFSVMFLEAVGYLNGVAVFENN